MTATDGVRVTVLGSGDAFGSDGRLQSGYVIQGKRTTLLMDCGVTVLPALKKYGIDPGAIDFVLISHLHGDHFGGLPFLLLEYLYETPRQRPLVVLGPPGIGERTESVFAALYREAASAKRPFALRFLEVTSGQVETIESVEVRAFRVPHQTESVSLGFRITIDGRHILYSGDSAWSEDFVAQSQGTDLFLCECFCFHTRLSYHMNYQELSTHVDRLGCKRLVLVHLGSELLASRDQVTVERAEDGTVLVV